MPYFEEQMVDTINNDISANSARTQTQTFASYLAKQYIVQKGFTPGVVPEAEELVSASDIVLTFSDGITFKIICIIDCESNPNKRFELSPTVIQKIGEQCLKYSGEIQKTKMPVLIQIMEIGLLPISKTECERLKKFRVRNSKLIIYALYINATTQSVWRNALVQGFFEKHFFIKPLMREPRISDKELALLPLAVGKQDTRPFLTYALIILLSAVFIGEFLFAIAPHSGLLEPDIRTLVALGGLNKNLISQYGEWYRLLSSTFLHGGIVHLICNGVALCIAGLFLEVLIGRMWFLMLFVSGALGGSFMSLIINAETIVSIGASGAIMGLLAACLICSSRLRPSAEKIEMQFNFFRILIPSLIPIAIHKAGQQIDFAGHIGGALIGTVIGIWILKNWPQTKPLPKVTRFTKAIALIGVFGFIFSFFQVSHYYNSYVARASISDRPSQSFYDFPY